MFSIIAILILCAAFIAALWIRAIPAYASVEETAICAEGIGRHEYTEVLANATAEDIELLERVVYNEAGHCTDWRVRLAVVETVLNRVLSDDFPNTISKVCKQRNQFVTRPIKGATKYELEGVSDAIEEVIHSGRTVLPSTEYVFFAVGKQKEATDHVLVGNRKRRWQYMWFGKG